MLIYMMFHLNRIQFYIMSKQLMSHIQHKPNYIKSKHCHHLRIDQQDKSHYKLLFHILNGMVNDTNSM